MRTYMTYKNVWRSVDNSPVISQSFPYHITEVKGKVVPMLN